MPPKERKPIKCWTINSNDAKILQDLFRNGDIVPSDDAPKTVYYKYSQFFYKYDLGALCTNLYPIRDQVELDGGDPREQTPGRKYSVFCCTG
jgi:hypothetical protein